jgi:polysaccharide biosynthesis protein PslH
MHIARVKPDSIKNYRERIRYELDPSFLNTYFSVVSKNDQEMMVRMIHEYDLIWVHSIRTANEFRIYKWPHSIMDIDDIQSRHYASRAKADSAITRRLLDCRMSLIWRRRERLLKNRFDVFAVCSQNDRKYLNNGNRIHVIPNGFTTPSQVPNRLPTMPPRLGFIGMCGFAPNRDGIEWFIRQVWPKIKRVVPDVRLRLVGLESDKVFPSMGLDIDGLGFVKDPADEVATWSAMIVPIWFGGGTRVKIAEAFSRKCPVVSTSMGAFGYEVVNGEELLLADDAHAFGAACVRLIRSPELGKTISEGAWNKFLKNWTWDSIGASVSKAVEDCLTSNRN